MCSSSVTKCYRPLQKQQLLKKKKENVSNVIVQEMYCISAETNLKIFFDTISIVES